MRLIGQVVAGKYRLERKAGAGGMGVVYLARDLETQAAVAVKLLLPSANALSEKRFVREAEVLADLRAPEIVSYLAHGRTEDGSPFLVIEWLEGETLQDRLERDGPLGFLDAVKVGAQVATALAIAHRKEVVHRDIKPANLFLIGKSTDRVKTLDFGVARLRGEGNKLTEAGALVGSPLWLSPEQAKTDELDGRSDLFSLGSVLYACISGASPFAGQQMPMVLLSIARAELVPLEQVVTDVPPRLGELIGRLLRGDPEERPADARWVADELRAIQEILSPSSSRPLSRETLTLLDAPVPARPSIPEAPPRSLVSSSQAWSAPPPAPPSTAVSEPLAPPIPQAPSVSTARRESPRQTRTPMLLALAASLVLLAGTATLIFFLVQSAQQPTKQARASASGDASRKSASSGVVALPGSPPGLDELGLGDLSNVDPMLAFPILEKYLLKQSPGLDVTMFIAVGLPGGKVDLTNYNSGLTAINAGGRWLTVGLNGKTIDQRSSSVGWGKVAFPHCTFHQLYADAVTKGLRAEKPFRLWVYQLYHLEVSMTTDDGPTFELEPGTCRMKKT